MRNTIGLLLAAGLVAGPVVATEPTEGQTSFSSRIIGGEPSEKGQWPFMTALIRSQAGNSYQGQFCGASYLGDGWVLTAAHCVDDKKSDDFSVHIGIHDLLKASTQGQTAQVKAIYIHHLYDKQTYANDIALIKLTTEPNLASITLAKNDGHGELLAGTKLTVMGWGNTEKDPDKSSYPSTLYQVNVPYVLRSNCQNLGGNYHHVSDNALCAGFINGGKDSCQGDSGGPLIYQYEDRIEQVGIVSWGDGCAQPQAYGVYTNVSYFDKWIKKTIERPVQSSSSGGSIGWSLFGLSLLGWFRFRKGVRL